MASEWDHKPLGESANRTLQTPAPQANNKKADSLLHYVLNVQLDEIRHQLHGHLRLQYVNHSRDTLREVLFHLWPNAYAGRHTELSKQLVRQQNRKLYFAEEDERGWMDSLLFSDSIGPLQWENRDVSGEICAVHLREPLPPGGAIELSTPFRVAIPSSKISRLGHSGNQYQITQWYPKPAVYQSGTWHTYPYLSQGEFFGDFARFDVFINVPSHFLVAATGNLLSSDENGRMWALSDALKAGKYNDSTGSYEILDALGLLPESPRKTLHFQQDLVHDFAWFADPNYAVLIDEFRMEEFPHEIRSEVFFNPGDDAFWSEAPFFIRRSVEFYSNEVGPYPYAVVKVVDGALSAGAGMEYPTITVIPRPSNLFSLDRVITHELGHNWFYGILASDERAHPWMDEGMNSALEYYYLKTYYPNQTLIGPKSKNQNIREWLGIEHLAAWDDAYVLEQFLSRSGRNEPVTDSAQHFSAVGYGALVYGKTGMLFEGLRAYLGNTDYRRAMQQYYDEYKFKHPTPDQALSIFEQTVDPSHDLRSAFESIKPLEYRWKNTKNPSVLNSGEIAYPITVGAYRGDSLLQLCSPPPIPPGNEFVLPYIPETADRLVIDPLRSLPEWNRRNNYLHTDGWLRRRKPIKLRLVGGLDNPSENTLYYTPDARWNNYDKLMTGITIYNKSIIPRTFEYRIAPMYAWGSQNLSGSASAVWNLIPISGPWSKIQLGMYAKMNEYAPDLSFYRLSPTVNFWFRRTDLSESVQHSLRLRMVQLHRELGDLSFDQGSVQLSDNEYRIFEFRYRYENGHGIQPHFANLTLQHANSFTRLSLNGVYRRHVSPTRLLRLRAFAGIFLENTYPADEKYYNFGLSGTADYMFDYYFLGRSDEEGVWNRQFFVSDGGVKEQTDVFANAWMTAANVQVPLVRWINYYVDGALYQNDGTVSSYWGHGIALNLITDFFEIYMPLPNKDRFFTTPYSERIRFILNLDLDDAFHRISRGQI